MSDSLVQHLESRPEGMEQSLSAAMKSIGERIVVRPEIVRALSAAEQLKPGYVIESETEAVTVADLVAQVIDGEKALASQVKDALRIPKAMEAALKSAVSLKVDALAMAKKVGNEARVAWQNTVRRRAAEEEARRRKEAEEAAREAAALAETTGDDIPPPAEVAPVEVPKVIAGGTGKMGIQVRIEVGGIVDIRQVPREWLELVPATARAYFNAAVASGQIVKPAPGESVVWNGVKFESKEFAVNRR